MHRFGAAIVLLLGTAVALAATHGDHEPIFGVGCFAASVAAWAGGVNPWAHGALVAVSLLVIADPADWLFSAALAVYLVALSLWLCAQRGRRTTALQTAT